MVITALCDITNSQYSNASMHLTDILDFCQFSDLPRQLRAVFLIPVAVHFLPDVRSRGGGRGDGGAVVSVAEALPLQDVLGVLSLQVAGQHGGIGHAGGESKVTPVSNPASLHH